MHALPLAELPALPLHTAGRYVAAAYIVAFALVLVYVAIMALRLSRIERDLGELLSLSEQRDSAASGAREGAACAGAGSEPALRAPVTEAKGAVGRAPGGAP